MTDETFDKIVVYLKERGCYTGGNLGNLLAAKVVVDEDLEMDEPVLAATPDPPEVRVSPSDFDDLRRRVQKASLEEGDQRG